MSVRPTAAQRYQANFRAGLIVIGLTTLVVYLSFGGWVPFRGGFEVNAIVSSANQLHAHSPVRIAGVNVGEVTKVTRGPGTTAKVTMKITDKGLPLHKDATLKIRPRLFLEGNFFVDLKPGTPSAPKLKADGTLPLSQTAVPVQFDQVLTTLQQQPREALKTLVDEYSTALRGGGAQAINRTFKPSAPALKGIALVSQESLGLSPHDASQLLSSATKVTSALSSRRAQLSELVTNFNRTVAAFADNEAYVADGTRELGALARVSYPALTAVDASLPSLRRFSVDVRPLLRRSPRTLDLTLPLLRQLNGLSSQPELPSLLRESRPALRSLAAQEPLLQDLMSKVTPVSRCVVHNVLPTITTKLDDGKLSTGMAPWQELLTGGVGLADASQDFDGNGHHVRYMATGGETLVSTGKLPGADTLYGLLQQPLLGSRPRQPAKKPPFRPDVPCDTQDPPNLAAATHAPPAQRQINVHPTSEAAARKLLQRARTAIAKAAAK